MMWEEMISKALMDGIEMALMDTGRIMPYLLFVDAPAPAGDLAEALATIPVMHYAGVWYMALQGYLDPYSPGQVRVMFSDLRG
jgi:hypothetical protein